MPSMTYFIDEELFSDILLEKPYVLIQFKMFKKTVGEAGKSNNKKDKRLIRIRNSDTVPVGVWARWFISQKYFQNFILLLIAFNALILGLQLELDKAQSWRLLQVWHSVVEAVLYSSLYF
jgi:hypothetical protein